MSDYPGSGSLLLQVRDKTSPNLTSRSLDKVGNVEVRGPLGIVCSQAIAQIFKLRGRVMEGISPRTYLTFPFVCAVVRSRRLQNVRGDLQRIREDESSLWCGSVPWKKLWIVIRRRSPRAVESCPTLFPSKAQ